MIKFKYWKIYIERIYSTTSSQINSILDSLDRTCFPLLNEYKFIRLSYVMVSDLHWINSDFLILMFIIIKKNLNLYN
jgi:hypothetical protein